MEFKSGNIFIRPIESDAGSHTGGHTHNFDHTTIVFTGSVRVRATLVDGTEVEETFAAPGYFLVKKDVTHDIEALEDDTVYWCVYSHRDAQGEVTQEANGWTAAYL